MFEAGSAAVPKKKKKKNIKGGNFRSKKKMRSRVWEWDLVTRSSYFFFSLIQTRHSEQPLQETVVGQHLQEARSGGLGGPWRVLEWASGSPTLRVQDWCHRPGAQARKLNCTPFPQPLK